MQKIIATTLCLFSTSLTFAAQDLQSCLQKAALSGNDIQLMLNDCNIKDSDVPTIASYLNTHPGYQELYLDDNLITDNGAKELAKLTIDYLSVTHNQIGSEGARSLAQNNSFTTLWLSKNPIGDEGAAAFADNQKLMSIYLSFTQITADGAKRLAKNNTLTSIDVDHNPIGDEGIAAFGSSKNLTWLTANDTQMGDGAAAALAKSTSIQNLEIGYNHVTDQGAYALAQASGPTGKYLYIVRNQLTDAGKTALKNSPVYSTVCTDIKDCLER